MATETPTQGTDQGQHLLVHVSGGNAATLFNNEVDALVFKAFLGLDGVTSISTSSTPTDAPWEFGEFWQRTYNRRVTA